MFWMIKHVVDARIYSEADDEPPKAVPIGPFVCGNVIRFFDNELIVVRPYHHIHSQQTGLRIPIFPDIYIDVTRPVLQEVDESLIAEEQTDLCTRNERHKHSPIQRGRSTEQIHKQRYPN